MSNIRLKIAKILDLQTGELTAAVAIEKEGEGISYAPISVDLAELFFNYKSNSKPKYEAQSLGIKKEIESKSTNNKNYKPLKTVGEYLEETQNRDNNIFEPKEI
jgi:hypothetical protein